MNNGVNNTNQTNNTETNTLAPMAGVKIAPAEEGPVNASGNQTATQQSSVLQGAPAQQPVLVLPQEPQVPQASRLDPQLKTDLPPVPTQTTQQVQQPAAPEVPQPTPQIPPQAQPTAEAPKKKINISVILIVLLVLLGGYTFYTINNYNNQINNIRYNCTPINTDKEIELDVNSTLVKDLYSKVETNIREDLANPYFDDSMRLYLAYRQLKEKDKYDSNCNLFSGTAMEPYKCDGKFVPKAFKTETLEHEIKILYGDDTNIPFTNIQLGNSCVIGYQYIEDRGEYVEGYCTQQTATSFKATKTLTKATSTKNTIILTEEVKYHENEKMELPETLVSGTYNYTFRLDKNFNYVLVSKTYENKY